MYYHCRPLKYVEYGKVFPPPDPDPHYLPAYRWLGHYCGYCPQVWLSRCDVGMTGYLNRIAVKGRKYRGMRDDKDGILFGFDLIRGFPVDYEFWAGHFLGGAICRPNASVAEMTKYTAGWLDEWLVMLKEEDPIGYVASASPLAAAWRRHRPDFNAFLKGYVFVEHDQVVVPSLNLKSAKVVICRDERQKKALRRMGFIEDRIEIKRRRG